MSIDVKAKNNSLNNLWKSSNTKILATKNKKYAIISDLHLGDGGDADNFHDNERSLRSALKKYYDNDYHLILLGDIEEFWQFDYQSIKNRYNNTIYKDIRKFGDLRITRIFGNHDSEWMGYLDPTSNSTKTSSTAYEAIKMKDVNGNIKILLVHGHQGSKSSDKNSWFSRFFVRIFRGLEPFAKMIGLYSDGSATKSQIPSNYETVFYRWGKKNKVILICGHSHRAIFSSKSYAETLQDDINKIQVKIQFENDKDKIDELLKEINSINDKLSVEINRDRKIDPTEKNVKAKPCYFNSGCGLYNDGITNIEIEGDIIRLIKWNKNGVKKEFNSGVLSEYISKL